jgi:hypothetical protein
MWNGAIVMRAVPSYGFCARLDQAKAKFAETILGQDSLLRIIQLELTWRDLQAGQNGLLAVLPRKNRLAHAAEFGLMLPKTGQDCHITLPQLQNRLRVQRQWVWSYFTGQRSSRLIPEPPRAGNP